MTGSETGGVQQGADLTLGELAQAALPQARQPHRPDLGAGELPDRVTDMVEQSAHDPVAALVDHQLDERPLSVAGAHLDRADLDRSVLEDDAVAQLLEGGPAGH